MTAETFQCEVCDCEITDEKAVFRGARICCAECARYRLDEQGFREAVFCQKCVDLIGHRLLDGECDCGEDSEAVERADGWLCGACANKADWNEWLEATLDEVQALAKEYEWRFDRDRYSGGFTTRSRYYELFRACDACIRDADEDEDCTCETLKLRLSDHATCYCREDYSLAREAGGDDHTLEILKIRLSRPKAGRVVQ